MHAIVRFSNHPSLLLAALFLFSACPSRADQYHGNGNTGFGGAIGNGTLTLSDDGTNISGTLSVGGSMNDVLVLYLQTGTGGFTNTSGFNDQGDACRQAISGVSASGRSLLTFASAFQPNYAIALAPAAAGTGGLWQLANGGNNSLVYLTNVSLAPLNNTGPYTFSFPAALIGMIPGIRSTIQVFGTYVRTEAYRSNEAIAGDLTGAQGWNPSTQTAYADYAFNAGAVIVKLPVGVWAQRAYSPTGRDSHTAIWTGSEVIVWGGNYYSSGGYHYLSDGGRYNPVANSWTPLPTTGAPAARSGHTAVWTGSEMIVWGGGSSGSFNDGGRYSPAANTWTALPTTGAPAGRAYHTAVWTGSDMIVWGGGYNDGGRFDPAANAWTVVPSNGAPVARYYHTAVWTGSEMIVWGGTSRPTYPASYYADGGRYTPAGNSWTALPPTGAPAARYGHTAVWTGNEMIIWGGDNHITSYADGRRYNPAANSWTALPTTGAPAARAWHTAVWTGAEMIVWAGGSNVTFYADGGRYNPTANSWTALSASGAPARRIHHAAVWTGNEMIVWGGYYYSGSWNYYSGGGRYNPTANSWTALPVPAAPTPRYNHTAVWTGSEMIIWGGFNGYASPYYFNNGGRYDPTANTWTVLPTSGAPLACDGHTVVWTGSEMIVWGGYSSSSGYSNNGSRYNPLANTWTVMATTGAPAPRLRHTAVWTGSEMVVWGGSRLNSGWYYFNDGGRYNPVANSWTALPTTGPPAARESHTVVWTGSEMIVWGGSYFNSTDASTYYLNDGGRYNPVANSWSAMPSTGAPAGRSKHTAVWTGGEMIVWGGFNSGSDYNSGGRYNPTTDIWTGMPTNGAPAARSGHTAVWTGSEMIFWGGGGYNNGGRYNPAANSWTALPTNGAPTARSGHTAIWTGSEMIVWGGGSSDYLSDTWSYYPYSPAVRISRSGPNSAEVAWPVWHPTLRLCQTTNLAAGTWTTITNEAAQVGLENHVTVSPLNGGQFFRAEYP